MIRLHLDATSADVLVDIDPETMATVSLSVELEPNELTGRYLPSDFVDRILFDPTAAGPRARRLLSREGRALMAEVLELRRRLASVANDRDISRRLLPDEARALAAMLGHYADEAERRR